MAARYDVIVIGGGNAAMCAALSAREHGARVLVVEKAPEAWRGGNGFFTAGGFPVAFQSVEGVCGLLGHLSGHAKAAMEDDPHNEERVYAGLMPGTAEGADPALAMVPGRPS